LSDLVVEFGTHLESLNYSVARFMLAILATAANHAFVIEYMSRQPGADHPVPLTHPILHSRANSADPGTMPVNL
jgi:hypothetical protein